MVEGGAKRRASRSQEVLKRLLDADNDAKNHEESARQEARRRVDEAKQQARSHLDDVRAEAEKAAQRIMEEAERQHREQGEAAPRMPFGSIDAFRRHAEENRRNAVQYIVQWVTKPLK